MCIAILASNWFALFGLRSKVALFANTLEEQERRTHIRVQERLGDTPHMIVVAPQTTANPTPHVTLVRVDDLPPPSESAPAPPTALSSSARLIDLRAAATKLNKLNLLINLVLWTGLSNNIAFLVTFSQGTIQDRYGSDPHAAITPAHAFYPAFQNIAIGGFIWYVWVDTTVWRSTPALKGPESRKTFWSTLRHGAADVSSHVPTPQQQPPQQPQPPEPHQLPMSITAGTPLSPFTPDSPPLSGEVASVAPIDSNASHAPTGLSMRSGLTSVRAVRAEGDLYAGGEETRQEADAEGESNGYDGGASTIDHTHLRQTHHPFAIAEEEDLLTTHLEDHACTAVAVGPDAANDMYNGTNESEP
jgi:hypothetical protein